MKKGQISVEVIYAVGVMVIIFTIITGLAFSKRVELRKTDEYVSYRSECLKLSNYIAGIAAAGDRSQVTLNIRNQVNISSQGIIQVAVTEKSGAICTFDANITDYNLNPANYTIKNQNGAVVIV